MSTSRDEDAWLSLRCPQYFDFDAALSVPCPNDSLTNPPLRDAVYDSDEETRGFFRYLNADPSIHATPHDQCLSPVPSELRNLKPLNRNRPTIAFEEYLERYEKKKHNTAEAGEDGNSKPKTPTRRRKAPTTSIDVSHRSQLHTPRKPASTQAGATTPAKKPNSRRTRPVSPSRPRLDESPTTRKQSAPKERVPLRRQRPPERVTPPLSAPTSANSSAGTRSGPERATKSRSILIHRDASDPKPTVSVRIKRPTESSDEAYGDLESSDSLKETEQEKSPVMHLEVPETDNDVVKMMEEHNRRIRRKQHKSDGDAKRVAFEEEALAAEDPIRKARSHSLEESRRRRIDHTLPANKKVKRGFDKALGVQRAGVKKRSTAGGLRNNCEPTEALKKTGLPRKQVSGSERPVKTTQPIPFQPLARQKAAKTVSKVAKEEDGPSLDDLLRLGNSRVLEERKKRLPERRKAVLASRSNVLSGLEGQTTLQAQNRTTAKVAFTSAQASHMPKKAVEHNQKATGPSAASQAASQKQRADKNQPPASKRGLEGFRARSRSENKAPQFQSQQAYSERNPTKPNNPPSRPAQSFSERIKAAERLKMGEQRMDSDLQSILSIHNNKVQGNRKGFVKPER